MTVPLWQRVEYSTTMGFWWYLKLPACIHKYNLVCVKNNKNGILCGVNVLECATLLINYAAACQYYHHNPDPFYPHPVVLLGEDNATSELWTEKNCNSFLVDRTLSRLQRAMTINNSVGVRTQHITITNNVIVYCISHIKSESNRLRDFFCFHKNVCS